MSDLVINNTISQLTAKSDIAIPSTDGDAMALQKNLVALNQAVPLKKLDLNRDLSDPTKYAYTFEAMDGRKWKQNLWVVSGEPTVQDFNVGNGTKAQGWDEDEFEHHRPVRAVVMSLIRNFGLYDLKVRW